MPLFISKTKLSMYIIDEHLRFYYTWVLSKCSKNLFNYLHYFGSINRAYHILHYSLDFLAIISLNIDKKVLILVWALVSQKDYKN